MNYAIINDESLKKYNTLKLASKAELIAFPFNSQGVKEVFNNFKDRKKIIIGKGSNILLSKEYYNEDYLFINLKLMDDIFIEDELLYAEAGLSLSELAWFSIKNNIKGYEFLEDIPGTIGGAVIMNAGTHRGNIGQFINNIKYYDISKDEIIEKRVKNGDFNRRTSFWDKKDVVILGCEFKIIYGDYLESLNELLSLKKERFKKQPRNYPNAGSVFKRPIKDGKVLRVWKYIDKVGLRGYSENDAMISSKHTGFIVNKGSAKYEDINKLIKIIKEKVSKECDLELELEWKII